jgi:hypothetical protein
MVQEIEMQAQQRHRQDNRKDTQGFMDLNGLSDHHAPNKTDNSAGVHEQDNRKKEDGKDRK